MQLISCHLKIFSIPTKATLKAIKNVSQSVGYSGYSMTLICSGFNYPIMQMLLNLILIAFNAL